MYLFCTLFSQDRRVVLYWMIAAFFLILQRGTTAKESLMKKVKLIGIVALLAIIFLGVAGCESSLFLPDLKINIKNESSSTLTVSARIYQVPSDGVNWSGSIAPGKSQTVIRKDTSKQALYRYTITYTVNGKTGTKENSGGQYGLGGGVHGNADLTVTITQANVNNL